MVRVPLMLASLALVAACATTPPRADGRGPGNTLDARMQGNFNYRCANGETIEVRFAADAGVAVLIRGTERTELQRKPTSSGFIYQNGQTMIMGKDQRIDMVVPGAGQVQCTLI